jgi:ATP-dependent DNA ligase
LTGKDRPLSLKKGARVVVRHEQTARFIEPMECLPVEEIPEGELWTYELKLDGYRLVVVRTGGKVTLYSRRGSLTALQIRHCCLSRFA